MTLLPHIRMMCGLSLFLSCMVAPTSSITGLFLIITTVFAWLAVCRLPGPLIHTTLCIGLVLYAPAILLIPFIQSDGESCENLVRPAFAIPWSIFVRGLSGLFISMATIASLHQKDVRDGLLRLPIPGMLTGILLQIIHQTGILARETASIAVAMSVRGAITTRSVGWNILTSLPRVWLPRVMQRSERLASAMELRGYGCNMPCFHPSVPFQRADYVAFFLTIGVLVCALAARWSA